MIHYHNDDIDMIMIMCGVEQQSLPESFGVEYEIRLRMLHRAGYHGPMGPHGLIPLLRAFDIGAPKPLAVQINDLSTIKLGTPLLVNGRKARLLSHVTIGSVAVRFLDNDETLEVPNHSVRFDENTAPEIELDSLKGSADTLTPNERRLMQEEAKSSQVESEVELSLDATQPKVEHTHDNYKPGKFELDWNDVDAGEIVEVMVGDKWTVGMLLSVEGDKLTVDIDGTKGDYRSASVRLSTE